jgi:hypothetical protein
MKTTQILEKKNCMKKQPDAVTLKAEATGAAARK